MKSIEVVGAMLGGAILGAAIALLVAPRSGEETRAAIKHYMDDEIDKYRCKCRDVTERFENDVKTIRQEMSK